MRGLLALLALLAVAAAESVRETAIMNSDGDIFSGSLPDDEDLLDTTDTTSIDDYEYSGSGDAEDDVSSEDDNSLVTPETTIDNHIPDGPRNPIKPNLDEELLQKNEIVPNRAAPLPGDTSNEIPMAITGPDSFFQRTEVIIALAAGGVVSLLFAVFLILLLYYRMKKKDEGSYDLGKKPIYKKAPTNEFYA